MITEAELIEELEQRVRWAGSQRAAAEAMLVSENYICQVLSGRVKIGPAIYEGMGYSKVVMYERKGGEDA